LFDELFSWFRRKTDFFSDQRKNFQSLKFLTKIFRESREMHRRRGHQAPENFRKGQGIQRSRRRRAQKA
jgi:hypothetical protein